jgi:tryptophan synthase alpha chain
VKLATPALVVYLVLDEGIEELAEAAVRGGATALELGIPYSDPLGDGPTIQAATQRALDAGITPRRALALMAAVDGRVDVPLIPMTYGAIVEAYGTAAFARDAAAAGADAVIVLDVPPEESDELRTACAAAGVDVVKLVAPTSRPDRLAAAAAMSAGFVYLVAAVGVTGARESVDARVADLVAAARPHAGSTPLLAGFGISRPEHVRAVLAAGADGAIVGSAAVDTAWRGGAAALEAFVRELATGLR